MDAQTKKAIFKWGSIVAQVALCLVILGLLVLVWLPALIEAHPGGGAR